MNDRSLDQLLDAWMDLGPTSAPDRVADAARLEVRTTRQRPAFLSRWATRRFLEMNYMAKVGLAAVTVVVAALIGLRLLGGTSIGGPGLGDPTPMPTADADEAVVRSFVDAVNRGDAAALTALMAETVVTDQTAVDRADAIAYVLDQWCPMTLNDVERTGDMFLLDVTFRDNADGTCVAGRPGTTSSFVVEVHDGKVTRIP